MKLLLGSLVLERIVLIESKEVMPGFWAYQETKGEHG